MLNQLHVQNFALIEDITLNLKSGLNIITGETGAGKSILLGALGLISGKRADVSVVRGNAKKCIVEGEFSLAQYNLMTFFSENDLDLEEPTLIRREISSAGKSRAFVNDTPVNLSVLKELGEKIIDVHSQHSNLLLAAPEFTFSLLDGIAGQKDKLGKFLSDYSKWKELKKELEDLEEKQNQEKLNLEFNQFQLNELVTANLKEGEQEEIEKEFDLLNNAEEIKEKSAVVVNNILYGSSSVQEQLQDAEIALEKLAEFNSDYAGNKERLSSTLIEIKDIAEEVEQLSNGINSNSNRVAEIDERLGLFYSLQKKHNLASVEQLIERRNELQNLVDLVVGGDDNLEGLRKEISKIESNLEKQATTLSNNRKKAAKEVIGTVISDLNLMGISQAQLDFEIEKVALNSFGFDKIDILFSANKGKPLAKLNKTASGGELSRVMLSLKKIMSTKTSLPTIVFDEIDTGVSGEVADQMGVIMKEMGSKLQVITITHLPQIAAKGSAHYKVFKSHDSEITSSQIEELSSDLRIDEIAQMLSGSKITDAARQNAVELMAN